MLLPPESLANFEDLVAALRQGSVTAFIGAGLSASMQPTWAELHAELQQEAEVEPLRKFDPIFAPADFADFRDALGAERYLGILKRKFTGVVATYPDHYRLLDEINGFEQLVTTNYDEFLASVALSTNQSPRLAVYPNLGDIAARYVYLHGRAETAAIPRELVVCEDDYSEAYNAPGRAANMLQALFGRPGVFFGSSLSDPDLVALIRSRERNAGPGGVESLPPLYTFVAVDPGEDSDDAFTAAAAIATSRLRRLGVRAICYRKDEGHTQLRAVILQLRHEAARRPLEPLFLERARQLDRLGALAIPTPDDVFAVRSLIRSIPELAQHFFERSATSPAWFDALKDSVIVPGLLEPWRFAGDELRVAPWAAAPYVERIAPDRPDAIVELIHRLGSTENPHAQSALTWAAVRLPPAQFREVLPIVGRWTASPYRRVSQVHIPLVRYARSLSERGAENETVLAILDFLLTPVETGDEEGLELAIVDYWLPQLEEPRNRLARDLPGPTYALMRDRLLAAIAAAHPSLRPYSSIWRLAIEDHEQDHAHIDSAIRFLLDGTRDALVASMNWNRDAAAREIDGLLSSDQAIMRRLALHAARVHPDIIPLLAQPLLSEAVLRDGEHFHEVALLLSERFGELDDVSQDRVHQFIRDGAASEANELDELRSRRRRLHRWRWLAVLPAEYQTAEEQAWWEDARREFGTPPHPHFLIAIAAPPDDSGNGTAAVEPDPVEVAWHDGGVLALLDVLRGRTGELSTLARLVRDDPEGLLDLAPLLSHGDEEIFETYFGSYVSLVESDSATRFRWGPLIELLGRLTVASSDAPAKLAFKIGRLMMAGATSQFNPIPAELLDASFTVVASVIGVVATPLDGDPIEDGWQGRVHQLNHAAGIATDAFMALVWRQLRYAGDEDRHLQDEARNWIEQALTNGWGGQELRHALGQYGATLDWGEPGWLAAHLESIWPPGEDPAASNARRMFLHGFLHSDNWSIRTFENLRPMFVEGIGELAREHRRYFDEEGQSARFLRTLAAGWLNGVEGFDELLEEFVCIAPDTERATFVKELWHQFRFDPVGGNVDLPGTLAKRDAYWQRRVEELSTSLPVAERSEELGAFSSWPVRHHRRLRELEPRLAAAIDHLANGFYTAKILESIAARAEREPLPALRLLNRLAEQLYTNRDLQLWANSRELDAALEVVCSGAKRHHRPLIRQLANHLIRSGLADYAQRVDQCGK